MTNSNFGDTLVHKRHYETLAKLALHAGNPPKLGEVISWELQCIEETVHKKAEDWCNGYLTSKGWEALKLRAHKHVAQAFGGLAPSGLLINGDARGYALKLSEEATKELAEVGISLTRDWGGYGILAPDLSTEDSERGRK